MNQPQDDKTIMTNTIIGIETAKYKYLTIYYSIFIIGMIILILFLIYKMYK